jgi:hypothetical protein
VLDTPLVFGTLPSLMRSPELLVIPNSFRGGCKSKVVSPVSE